MRLGLKNEAGRSPMTTFVAAVRGPSIASADNLVTVWPVGEVLEAVAAAPNTMRKAEEERDIVSDRIRTLAFGGARLALVSRRSISTPTRPGGL